MDEITATKWRQKCKIISTHMIVATIAIGLIATTSFYARDFIFGSEYNTTATCGMSDKMYNQDGELKYRYKTGNKMGQSTDIWQEFNCQGA